MTTFQEMPGLSPAENDKARGYHERELRENALINQKNYLLELIYASYEPEDLEKVAALLAFAAPLWEAVDYAYKTRELRTLLLNRAERRLEAEETYLSGLRKNDRTMHSTKRDIERLRKLIADHKG
jgi:hypothetical protein